MIHRLYALEHYGTIMCAYLVFLAEVLCSIIWKLFECACTPTVCGVAWDHFPVKNTVGMHPISLSLFIRRELSSLHLSAVLQWLSHYLNCLTLHRMNFPHFPVTRALKGFVGIPSIYPNIMTKHVKVDILWVLPVIIHV